MPTTVDIVGATNEALKQFHFNILSLVNRVNAPCVITDLTNIDISLYLYIYGEPGGHATTEPTRP